MTFSNWSCSGYDRAELNLDTEFREILDAMFCACLEELQTHDARLRRDLFHLTEFEGQTPAAAAATLGLDIQDAEEMLAKIRRDVAVLLVLGLCKPSDAGAADVARFHDCSCRGN